jgi:hypothetical protein
MKVNSGSKVCFYKWLKDRIFLYAFELGKTGTKKMIESIIKTGIAK